MRIGIEGQRLFRRKKHGMDMVALELIRNLQMIDLENDYVIFVRPDEDDAVFQETENFRIVRLEGGIYPLWEQFSLPKAAKRERCDILHCTSNTAPVFTTIPIIDTLHDIIYMEHSYIDIIKGSGSAYQKSGNIYRKLIVPRIVKKSYKIITVSHFEKDRIARFFGMSGDKRLTAIYNGVGEHFKPVIDVQELKRVKNKYNLPDHFFFFLGNTDPKKNTKGTLKAYSDYVRQTGDDIQLVMLDYDRSELEKILDDIGNPALMSRIHLTGYVVNTDLPAIYSQCSIFLYPSLRESFGIPILEAMGCGAPVITSNTSSMPEIAGDAALIINPFKPEEITSALIKITLNAELCEQLILKGLEQAEAFTWRKMAEDVLLIYKEVFQNTKIKNK